MLVFDELALEPVHALFALYDDDQAVLVLEDLFGFEDRRHQVFFDDAAVPHAVNVLTLAHDLACRRVPPECGKASDSPIGVVARSDVNICVFEVLVFFQAVEEVAPAMLRLDMRWH